MTGGPTCQEPYPYVCIVYAFGRGDSKAGLT
jgi:hypothetical protein